MSRTRYEASLDKRRAVEQAEENGDIVDSMEARLALMAKVKSGEIPLEEAQLALKKLKREGKKRGLLTRQQVYSRS